MNTKQKKFLVTGGAGFIGSNLVGRLLNLGHFVRTVDSLVTGNIENIKEFLNNKNFEFIKGDLTDLDNCRNLVKDMDYIFHVAAIVSVPRSVNDPLSTNQANIIGTLNLLIAARDYGKIKKLVYSASGGSVYGNSPKLPKEETDPVDPLSPYALTKYAGERYCQIFSRLYGLPTVCLRYFNVFGPKQNPLSQYSAVIPRFIYNMTQGNQPIIYGYGEQTRDFTYVENVVDANILAVFSDVNDEVINIACGDRISVNMLVEFINDYLKTDIRPIYKDERIGEVKHSSANIFKAERLLGYKPKVYLKEGLEKTMAWFRKLGIFEITEHFALIRLAKETDIEQIAKLYQEKIKTGFLASFGQQFLSNLYEAIVKSKDTVSIVAEIDKQIVGFASGAVNINKFYLNFSKRYFLKVGLSIFSKILKPSNIKRIFETLFYPIKRRGLPKAELFVIAIGKGFENQEFDELLFKNFVKEMEKRGVKSFKSTVSRRFVPTIEFYKKMGFKFYQPVEIHKGHQSEIYIYNTL